MKRRGRLDGVKPKDGRGPAALASLTRREVYFNTVSALVLVEW